MQYVKYTKWINIAKQITKVHVNIVFWGKNKIITTTKQNKRAQRALGRSPEEKVKVHSWAIYWVPLLVLYTKYESSGPCSFRQEDFWKLHFKNIFLTRDLLMQQIRTIWTILVEDYPGTIPVEFGQIPISMQFKIRSHLKFSLYNSM